jgi:hypothetical protein
MAAVARLLPPRPTPKSSFPPPLLPQPTVEDIVHEVSDTAVNDVSEIRPAKPPPLPVVAKDRKAAHPGLILARTIGFFVAHLAFDVFRSLRAFVKAHWIRAAARARG